MTKKKQWIIMICIILMIIWLWIWWYFWYYNEYDNCVEFYNNHRCGLAKDRCTVKNVLFNENLCN